MRLPVRSLLDCLIACIQRYYFNTLNPVDLVDSVDPLNSVNSVNRAYCHGLTHFSRPPWTVNPIEVSPRESCPEILSFRKWYRYYVFLPVWVTSG